MARKLFCQLSPFCYHISVEKEIMLRNLRDLHFPGTLCRAQGRETAAGPY